MKLTETTKINRKDFELPSEKLEVKYGLPREVKFCVECNISNQQPMSSNEYEHTKDSSKTTLEFDDNGVCHACRFNKLKRNEEIDWDEREKELEELCNKHRKNDGSYDCIIGGSVKKIEFKNKSFSEKYI